MTTLRERMRRYSKERRTQGHMQSQVARGQIGFMIGVISLQGNSIRKADTKWIVESTKTYTDIVNFRLRIDESA